jgi:hypothetical protein
MQCSTYIAPQFTLKSVMPAWRKAHFALACTMLFDTLLPSCFDRVSQYHCQRSRSTAPLAGRNPRQHSTANWEPNKYYYITQFGAGIQVTKYNTMGNKPA